MLEFFFAWLPLTMSASLKYTVNKIVGLDCLQFAFYCYTDKQKIGETQELEKMNLFKRRLVIGALSFT